MKTMNISKLSLKELIKLEKQLERDIEQRADYLADCGNGLADFEDDQEIHEMSVLLDKVVKRIVSL
jgi:hypothetical protein